jgi:hypothetical protein
MHELKRRAYLDAMGIATYVSRVALPGAAATTKLVVVRRAEPAGGVVSGAEFVPPDKPANEPVRLANVDLGAPPAKPRRDNPPRAAGKLPVAPVVEFGITALVTGNWLWLEELPLQQALMRNQVLLVQSMARVLGWGEGGPDVSPFNWPIHTNSQLDLGVEAARASLGGFISRKLGEHQCRGLVVLGDQCQRWLPTGQLEVKHQLCTVSTAAMLRDPQLKKQAWRDLLPHAV